MPGGLTDHLINLPEAREALRVSSRTVERLAQQGHLERVKVGSLTRYRISDIERIIREGTRGPSRRVA